MIINLTPHEIRVLYWDRQDSKIRCTFPPSGQVVRVEMLDENIGNLHDVAVVSSIPGEISGLEDNGTDTYLVSRMVAEAAIRAGHPAANRMYVPAGLVRDNCGQVVGCTHFSTLHPYSSVQQRADEDRALSDRVIDGRPQSPYGKKLDINKDKIGVQKRRPNAD